MTSQRVPSPSAVVDSMPMTPAPDTADAPIPALWMPCPACGGLAGFRPVGGDRLLGACFEDSSCWWAGEKQATAAVFLHRVSSEVD